MIRIYNTLTRKKELFQPLTPGEARIYVCGMTVYDLCHMGHARILVAFDVVVRFLRAQGFKTTYVRNITDVDDKILQRARENGETFTQLTARMIDAMHEDCAALGVEAPDHEPRATEYVDAMVDMISTLVDKGYAYAPGNGDVYYRVRRFAGYGKLSGKVLSEMQAGARVEVDSNKEDPLDFVLWKGTASDEPGWKSPWGWGRPGWHIECSAMSLCCLGATFDIHGGGPDLRFPHHENEIAQSEAANDAPFANLWMHAGAVRVNNEKMSKSLNNFFTVRDVLARYPAEVVRYFFISSHYRSPINYSETNLEKAHNGLERLYTALDGLDFDKVKPTLGTAFEEAFQAAMTDDFNTPAALGVLFDMARQINKSRSAGDLDTGGGLAALMHKLGALLGLLQSNPKDFLGFDTAQTVVDSQWIEERLAERTAARSAGKFAEADRIRDLLTEQGVALEDSSQGTRWRMTR